MSHLKAIVLGGCILASLACSAPESSHDFEPYFDGYAVKEEVEPASFPDTIEPDVLLPGEVRVEVVEVPERPTDTDPPRNLDEEPVPEEPFPYGAWWEGGGRR
jgi:hypothetical protein